MVTEGRLFPPLWRLPIPVPSAVDGSKRPIPGEEHRSRLLGPTPRPPRRPVARRDDEFGARRGPTSERGRLDDVSPRGGSPSRRASLRPRRWRSAAGDHVRRTQDHPAEPPVGRLTDLAASLQRFQVVEDEAQGLVAPREDGVADESLDPFDDRGFEMHGDSTRNEP